MATILKKKYLSFVMVAIALSITYFYIITFFDIINLPPIYLPIFSIIGATFFAFFYFTLTGRLQEPPLYHVSIVGFPKSGKTTLIIRLFGEAFAHRLPIRMIPKGSQTIDLVNQSLSILEKGKSLGPTTDQDRFSFRGEVTIKVPFLSGRYNVEFGDFPGHDSQQYMEEYGPWLHKTEFFKWVSNSDAIIFVIDLAHYINLRKRNDYIVEISSAIRAAWQHLIDVNEYRIKVIKKMPIILVFNKADLFSLNIQEYKKEPKYLNEIEEKIMRIGFGDETPEIVNISTRNLSNGENKIKIDFDSLIKYLERETSNLHIILTSSFGLYQGTLLGIKELFNAAIPN